MPDLRDMTDEALVEALACCVEDGCALCDLPACYSIDYHHELARRLAFERKRACCVDSCQGRVVSFGGTE